MRIAFFTDTYLPARSGMEISIESFRSALESMGHELFVFTPTMHGYKDENKNVYRFRSVRMIRKPEMRLAFPWGSVDSSVSKIREIPFDVVHVHSPFTMGLLGRHIARTQNVPLIFTNHCHHTEYAKIYFKEPLVLPYTTEKWIKWFSNQTDRVIAPSSKFKELLQGYGVIRPIDIVQTGIEPSLFATSETMQAAARAVRKRHGIPEGAHTLLYVGRMSDEKNVLYLIDALAELEKKHSDTHMLFVGEGKARKRYEEAAKEHGIRHAIFTGTVQHENMPAYYNAADAFLFASLTDTQGIVILEAMASGLPVVALRDGALIDVIHHKQNGFLLDVKAAPETFAAQVEHLLEDKAEYRRVSANALATAAKFTEINMAEQLAVIYEGLVTARKLRHAEVQQEVV
ncbi:MAG: glycosyltransferase [Patescibacteria group bacterium]